MGNGMDCGSYSFEKGGGWINTVFGALNLGTNSNGGRGRGKP